MRYWFADAVFVIPTSSRVGVPNIWKVKTFLKSVAETLNIGPDKTRAGLITYGRYASIISSLGETATLEEFEHKIDIIPYEKGQERVDRALLLAARMIVKGNAREEVPRLLVLLEYEEIPMSAGVAEYVDTVQAIKLDGVNIFILKVGNAVEENGIDNKTTFAVRFDKLERVVGSLSNSLIESASKVKILRLQNEIIPRMTNW